MQQDIFEVDTTSTQILPYSSFLYLTPVTEVIPIPPQSWEKCKGYPRVSSPKTSRKLPY